MVSLSGYAIKEHTVQYSLPATVFFTIRTLQDVWIRHSIPQYINKSFSVSKVIARLGFTTRSSQKRNRVY